MKRSRLASGTSVLLFAAMATALLGCTSESSDGTSIGNSDAEAVALPTGFEPQPLNEMATVQVNVAAMAEPFSALFLADELGEFEKENIEIEYQFAPAAEAIQALVTGQVDMAASSITAALLNAIAGGSDVRAVMQLFYDDPAQGLYVRTDLLGDPKNLEGGTIASVVGAGGHLIQAVDHYLSSAGMSITDVDFQVFSPPDVPAALEAGAVDAAWVLFPFGAQIEADGIGEMVQSAYPEGFSGGSYLFGPDLLENRPEVGQALVRAMARTQQTWLQQGYKDDPEVVAALVEAMDSTEEQVLASPELVFEEAPSFPLEPVLKMQDLWREHGGLLDYAASDDLTPDQIVDVRFVDAVNG